MSQKTKQIRKTQNASEEETGSLELGLQEEGTAPECGGHSGSQGTEEQIGVGSWVLEELLCPGSKGHSRVGEEEEFTGA